MNQQSPRGPVSCPSDYWCHQTVMIVPWKCSWEDWHRGAPPGEDGAWSLIVIASCPSLLSSFFPSLLKSPYSQSYGLSSSHVRMWELDHKEDWVSKNWELWCWRRLLRVPWTARRSNQSILKEINPEYSLEGLELTLKLQYFGHLMQKADSLEKTLILGNIEGRRRRGQWRMRWLDGIIDTMDMNLRKL